MKCYSKILVTGGAGFIGSHIVDQLLECEEDVIVVDDLSEGRLENISHHLGRKKFCFVQGDIRNSQLVKKLVKDAELVFHQAALVSVPQSLHNPILTNEVNIKGTLNLLKAAVE